MAYFPLFIEMEQKRVLAVGAGAVGSRRIEALADFGAEVFVVAGKADPRVEKLAGEGRIRLFQGDYARYRERLWGDGSEGGRKEPPFFLVLTATGDRVTDEMVIADGSAHGAFVNCAGDRSRSDFYFPGLAREGDVTAGVVAGGTDHRKAKILAEQIRGLMKCVGKDE